MKPSNILIGLDGHIKMTDFGLAGSMLLKEKQEDKDTANPLDGNLADTSGTVDIGSSDENNGIAHSNTSSNSQSCSSDDNSMSSEEPDWTDDENTDEIKADLRRVRRRTLCGTAGYRPPEQVGERFVDYANRNGYGKSLSIGSF